jgi:hypothetical protein
VAGVALPRVALPRVARGLSGVGRVIREAALRGGDAAGVNDWRRTLTRMRADAAPVPPPPFLSWHESIVER